MTNLWSLNDAPRHTRERIIPSGTLELVINLAENEFRIYDALDSESCRRFSGAIVSGAYEKFFVIDTQQHASVIGVHFKPSGAYPFLGIPPGALAATHVDLETLWGPPARQLRDMLCLAHTPAQRFQILEAALTARLARPTRQHDAVTLAVNQLSSGSPVRDVVEQVGLSHRRFIEIFTAQVGMTPKLFSRVQRFQRASSFTRRQSSLDWSNVAVECGYCDQSHLIRDFITFSGLSPVDFVRHSIAELKENHLALLDEHGSNSSNTEVESASRFLVRKSHGPSRKQV